MLNTNDVIQKRIKKEFLLSNEKRNIRIPSGISFSEEGNSVKMKLSSDGVCVNMQDDSGAFEGWALVLRRWGKYEKVIISWDTPDLIDNGHYQRFLFRLIHFTNDFNSWFYIEEGCKKLLEDLKIKENVNYLLNMPDKNRGDEVKPKPEAILEDRFVNGDLRERLMNITNATDIYRQLPVRAFNVSISEPTAIFARGFIDMWGISDNNELLVFELKADNNEKVGIISELYFYVCVLQKLRKQVFKHENCHDNNKHLLKIPTTKKIRAYFLAPTLHPLVDGEILRLLDGVAPGEISYQYIQFDKEYNLVLNTYSSKS